MSHDMTLLRFCKAIEAIGFKRIMWGIEDTATGESMGYAYDNGVISLRKTLTKLQKLRESQARRGARDHERAERDARLAAKEARWKETLQIALSNASAFKTDRD